MHELDGVWTNREVTGMKAVPRRLLVLGGGPVGVEMAQTVRRFGGEVVVVEHSAHVLAREPKPLGEALGEVLRGEGVELVLGRPRGRASRRGRLCPAALDGRALSGDRLLLATGRRPRVDDLGLETVGIKADARGIPVDDHLRAAERTCGDRRHHRDLAIDPRRQVPGRGRRFEPPGRAAHGELRGRAARRVHRSTGRRGGRVRRPLHGDRPLRDVAKNETYSRSYAESRGFLTLCSDGERLTGAYALGPEAGEWLQQATLAIRAHVPLPVLYDTIQPFPTFSEIFVTALHALRAEVAAGKEPARVDLGG
jgi:dihydrolipoamide dehydrogenase